MALLPKLLNKLGNPVSGDDFWPRLDVVDNLYNDLVQGKGSRRLFGLRRIGKTSVLLELERRLLTHGAFTVIRIDVQGISRFKDFLSKLFEQIPLEGRMQNTRQKFAANKVFKSLLPALWGRVTGTAGQEASSGFQNEFDHNAAWAGDIEAALQEAGPIVLLIDELPYMLRNMMKEGYKAWDVERFLATLRSWRMNSGVRMLLSGSVGLAQLSRTDRVHVADHIGDLFPVLLPPLPIPQAIAMVDALARGQSIDDWSMELSAAVVGASAETWPIFLQYGFDAAIKAGVRDSTRVTAAIESTVRQALDETFYTQFATRLTRYDADLKTARIILRTVVRPNAELATFEAIDAALAEAGAGATERRDDLLEALREDDFIIFDTESQTVRPASKLVPVWVRARPWGR
jgi:hypothetical protein